MFYVLCANAYGTSEVVKKFDTRPEALSYIESLPEDIYMVILRNDSQGIKPLKVSE